MSHRSVIVVDADLAPGLAANAAAVLAVTLGAIRPELVGEDVHDADGVAHPGLIRTGLPVLRAAAEQLSALRPRAAAAQLGVIVLPAAGQATTDYDAFRAAVGATPTEDLGLRALALHGARREVARLTGSLALLR